MPLFLALYITGFLFQLEHLNLGNNRFQKLPDVLENCGELLKLHAFGNSIDKLNPNVIGEKPFRTAHIGPLFCAV